MNKWLLISAVFILLFSCENAELVKELGKKEIDIQKVAGIVQKLKKPKIDNMLIDGKPVLFALVENNYQAAVISAVQKGASIVFEGDNKFILLKHLLAIKDYRFLEWILCERSYFKNNGDARFFPDKILEEIGFDDHASGGQIIEFLLWYFYMNEYHNPSIESFAAIMSFQYYLGSNHKAMPDFADFNGERIKIWKKDLEAFLQFLQNTIKNDEKISIKRLLSYGYQPTNVDLCYAAQNADWEMQYMLFPDDYEWDYYKNDVLTGLISKNCLSLKMFKHLFPSSISQNDIELDDLIAYLIHLGMSDCASYAIKKRNTIRLHMNNPDVKTLIDAFLRSSNIYIYDHISDKYVVTSQLITDKTVMSSLESYGKSASELLEGLDKAGVSPYKLLMSIILSKYGFSPHDSLLYLGWYYLGPWYKKGRNEFNNCSIADLKNLEYLESKEKKYAEKTIIDWLENKEYEGASKYYDFDSYYLPPPIVESSLQSLNILPASILLSEVYARNGYGISNTKIEDLFKKTTWYVKTKSGVWDYSEVDEDSKKKESANLILLKSREWLDCLNNDDLPIPFDIERIPSNGGKSYYIKQINLNGVFYYLGSFDVKDLIPVTNEEMQKHSDHLSRLEHPEFLVSKESAGLIKDDFGKIVEFFEKKPFWGYTDSVLLKPVEMQPPEYLKESVDKLRIDWLALLAQEILARHGMRLKEDSIEYSIFVSTSWYRPKEEVKEYLESDLCNKLGLNRIEFVNFLALEGQNMKTKINLKNASFVLDAEGGLNIVKIARVIIYTKSMDNRYSGSSAGINLAYAIPYSEWIDFPVSRSETIFQRDLNSLSTYLPRSEPQFDVEREH